MSTNIALTSAADRSAGLPSASVAKTTITPKMLSSALPATVKNAPTSGTTARIRLARTTSVITVAMPLALISQIARSASNVTQAMKNTIQ